MEKVLAEYRQLLDSGPHKEEVLQDYLKRHPYLLCPAYSRVWPNLELGSHTTDFVFRDAIGDYLLVELERAEKLLFRKNGHQTAELTEAEGQIFDWKRYIEDNLPTVQRELGLDGISSNPRSVVVIGRSRYLTSANRRKLTTKENSDQKLKIMTYDDVLLNARAVIGNILGTPWETSETVEIFYSPKGGG